MKFRALVAALSTAGAVLVAAPAHAASPVITNQTNSLAAVYPVVDGYRDTITFGWKLDQAVSSLTLDVVDSATNTSVFSDPLAATATSYVWNGLVPGGSVAPDGTYYVRITADNGADPADSNNGPLFSLSNKKLTQHTLTKRVTAGGSQVFMIAGKCSQVRRPGLRLGAGSIGYYSNTKCTKAHEDMVLSAHQIAVPSSFRPAKASLSAYGMATKAGSTMSVGFTSDRTPLKLGSARGWHNGTLHAVKTDPGGLSWMALAGQGNRYDIKYFKITYTYTTLA